MKLFNAYQAAAAAAYACGDYDQCTSVDQVETIGDTLLLFIIRELQDPENLGQAIDRMRVAIEDINIVLDALEALEK